MKENELRAARAEIVKAMKYYRSFMEEVTDEDDPHLPKSTNTTVGELLGFLSVHLHMDTPGKPEERPLGDSAPMPQPFIRQTAAQIENQYNPENDLIPHAPKVTATDYKLYLLIKDLHHRVLDLEGESEI